MLSLGGNVLIMRLQWNLPPDLAGHLCIPASRINPEVLPLPNAPPTSISRPPLYNRPLSMVLRVTVIDRFHCIRNCVLISLFWWEQPDYEIMRCPDFRISLGGNNGADYQGVEY